MSNDTVIIEIPAEMSRKRKQRPDEWKRNVAKKDSHSFIPPARVFGNLERNVKANNVIVNPEEYLQVFDKFSTVFHLGNLEEEEEMDFELTDDDALEEIR
uniref:(California timema) hypothetical protein n=1 Tax=Timema californicum TaxID=61474 RepID=A0A7R9JEK0_TIMCA|nr:unnamed protein product [Timema californicum]